jgi:hypothetical protein
VQQLLLQLCSGILPAGVHHHQHSYFPLSRRQVHLSFEKQNKERNGSVPETRLFTFAWMKKKKKRETGYDPDKTLGLHILYDSDQEPQRRDSD